jgi:hypothetical protein
MVKPHFPPARSLRVVGRFATSAAFRGDCAGRGKWFRAAGELFRGREGLFRGRRSGETIGGIALGADHF